jgi:VacB/RNase II family 3'-5' exoribonuclease
MTVRRIAGAPLDFGPLRVELKVPGDFASAERAQAQAAADRSPADPVCPPPVEPVDAREIPLVTIDPKGSRDLDQAVWCEQTGSGYRVQYAIADVASFVPPSSALDMAAHARGETLYFPDLRIPLWPAVLSEGAASLLPGADRPAVLWQIELDERGDPTSAEARRAMVRSRAQYDYEQVQQMLDGADAPAWVTALAAIGARRLARARDRHAIDLDRPEQEVVAQPGGSWSLVARVPLPVERYNAEISLLTGMCAASIMLRGGVGVLRTVPEPGQGAIDRLRHAARALGIAWPGRVAAGDVLAALDRSDPRAMALLDHATALLRGAGYTVFDGAPPAGSDHAGVGAPYAHVTAPLRRLVDRFGSEICLAVQAGSPAPPWVRDALPGLPEQMQRADALAHAVARAVVDMTEAWLLRDRVGEVFDAVVIDANVHPDANAAAGTGTHERSGGTVVLDDPPVRAHCAGALQIGARIAVRLVSADVASRTVAFEPA